MFELKYRCNFHNKMLLCRFKEGPHLKVSTKWTVRRHRLAYRPS